MGKYGILFLEDRENQVYVVTAINSRGMFTNKGDRNLGKIRAIVLWEDKGDRFLTLLS